MKPVFTKEQLKDMGKSAPYVSLVLRKEEKGFDMEGAVKKLGKKPLFFLESAEIGSKAENNRYCYLGEDPLFTLTVSDGVVEIREKETVRKIRTDNPASLIARILEERRTPDIPGFPPFTGGFAGAFSYDFFKYAEPVLKLSNENPDGFQDAVLMFFDQIAAYDKIEGVLYLIRALPSDFSDRDYSAAVERLKALGEHIIRAEEKPGILTVKGEVDFGKTQEEYSVIVERAKDYIRQGDIFQCVPSNRIRAEVTEDSSLYPVYQSLKKNNPSPYMYYFSFDGFEAAGSSPETLLRKRGSQVSTVPIAGTRPRGRDEEEDRLNEKSLLNDPKELAEHNMLVDLARNDIGKIAKVGSVKVSNYLHVKRFSNVMHLCSNVGGVIKDDLSAMDALSALLPAGTLSGAPKIRACEIIEELEDEKRGLYGGSAGYLSTNGNMDMCIAIRTAFKKGNQVIVQSGGGIVADSDPVTEFNETRHKARAVIRALEEAM